MVRRVVLSGIEVEAAGDRPEGYYGITITAPGADVLPWDEDACTHHPDVECSGKLGCVVDEMPGLVWNATAPRRWSWFVTYLRRRLGPLEYVGTWEWQERGVLHRHFVVRLERPASLKRVQAVVRNAGRQWGFGSQYKVKPLTRSGAAEASYLASYVSKSADAIDGRRMLDLRTGELRARRGFRPWSCSRKWGASMGELRASQRAWWLAQTAAGPAAAGAGDAAGAAGLDPYSGISTAGSREGDRVMVAAGAGGVS